MATTVANTTTTTTVTTGSSLPRHEGTIIYEGPPSCLAAPGQWCNHTSWKITTTYIERQTGICCQNIDNLELIRVKDIQLDAGCCCCECCSTIKVISSDATTPELLIPGLPDAVTVFHKIRDAFNALQGNTMIEMRS